VESIAFKANKANRAVSPLLSYCFSLFCFQRLPLSKGEKTEGVKCLIGSVILIIAFIFHASFGLTTPIDIIEPVKIVFSGFTI
jgi:hypothetical protein